MKAIRLLSVISAIGLAQLATAQVPNTLLHSIPAPPTVVQTGAKLGSSVAVDGGYTVIGAPYDDTGAMDSGVVKVFNSTTGALLFVLPNPTPAAGDLFGWSVAISGTRVVVGAYRDDTGSVDAGSAYVYDLSNATPTVPVTTLNNPIVGIFFFDDFGFAVAISGMRVAVGADEQVPGRVYVYDLGTGTPTVPVHTLINPGASGNDEFGTALAMSGTRLVVGASNDNTMIGSTNNEGRAYVYDLSSATPTVPVVTLENPTPKGFEYFGWSVAISGTRVAVGTPFDDYGSGVADSGDVYVFDLTGLIPTVPIAILVNPSPVLDDNFGISVAMSGTRVVVGAYGDDTGATDAGSTYVYDMSSGTPTVPVAMLNNPGPAVGDQFGNALAISGTRLVVGAFADDLGASDAGSAYVYELGSGTPTVPMATLNDPGAAHVAGDNFGNAVAASGTLVVVGSLSADVGASNAGVVQVYDLSSGTPTVPVFTLNNPSPAADDNFGYSVAISGARVVVGAWHDDTGASNAGSAYVYDLAGATPTVPVATLNNPSPASDDLFGNSVSISGTRVVVGAYLDDTGLLNSGRAYVYELSSGTPTVPVFTLSKPGFAADDLFGTSVSISGTRVVVGAVWDDTGASAAGSAYVFDLSSGTPTVPVFTLHNPGPAASDTFGWSVAISGTRVVVGAHYDDTGASDSGSAYVYELTGGTPTTPIATLANPSAAVSDNFGLSVSISGARVVVGSHNDSTGAANAGSAYVYDTGSGTPTVPVATLNNPAPAVGDTFGYSVAISGTTVAIGIPNDDAVLTDEGAAYIYGPLYVTTTAATGVTNVGATLNGTANPSGVTTTAQFQYGLTTAYGSTAGVALSPDNGTSPQAVSAVISGLLEGRTYHFRLTTTNSLGTNYGLNMSFTTLSGEIAVEQPVGTNLGDGDTLPSFGGFLIGTSSTARVFTIKNYGTANLTALAVTKDGTHAADFIVSTTGMTPTVIPTGSTTFTVTFSPGGTLTGTRTAALHITSNDPDENPFDIPLTGQGFSTTQDTDSDGLNDGAEFLYTALGFDWQVSQTALVTTLNSGANTAGHYTPAQVQALNIDTPLLQRHPTTGIFTLIIGIEKSTNLSTSSPFPMTAPQTLINGTGKLEFQFTVPDDAAFFQLRAQ